MTKKNLITFTLTVIFSALIAFLIYKKFVYPTVIPVVKNGLVYIFADWSAIVNANVCLNKGFNVFTENPCDLWGRKHVYGEILLHLPLVEKLNKFYNFYFPIILNIIFIFVIISLFDSKISYKNFSLILIIFSLPVILAIERANLDIFIFLTMFLISKYKNLFLSHLLIIFSTLAKFYPIFFGIIFLFQKNIKKVFLNISILLLFVILFVFFQRENLIEIFNNSSQFSGSGIYQFSINGLIRAIPNIQIEINNISLNWVVYIFIIVLLLFPMIFAVKALIKNDKNNRLFSKIFDLNTFENRLYIVSTLVLLFCYFTVQNFVYREIFLIGLIPWILKNEDIKNNFLNLFFYLILIKIFLSTIFTIIIMNKFYIELNFFMNLFKHMLDFYVISTLSFILLLNLYNLAKNYYLTKNY